MKTSSISTGAYLILEGDQSALNDWLSLLSLSGEPRVIPSEHGLLLASAEFTSLSDDDEVRAKGAAVIDRVNAVTNVTAGTQPLSFERLFRVYPDGTESFAIKLESNRVFFGRGDEYQPPVDDFQKFYSLAIQNAAISRILEEFGRINDWYGIYKTIEHCEALVGSERKLQAFLRPNGAIFKNMRTTANWYRHADAYRPPHPTDYGEAYIMLRKAVDRVIRHLVAGNPF